MKNVINVRKNLATKQYLIYLVPLTNPANTKTITWSVLIKTCLKMHCNCLKELGSKQAVVVHGLDGLDEISLSNKTLINELKNDKIKNIYLTQ